ncbi:MAG: hypothetical protein MI673_07170 [Thiotrichales bacterium]|nr:hypothetical protein [Thiotrichales bacterium]
MSNPTTVEAADPAKQTSEIVGPLSEEATVTMTNESKKCLWNDQEFNQGDRVSVDGTCYECSFGRWVEITN